VQPRQGRALAIHSKDFVHVILNVSHNTFLPALVFITSLLILLALLTSDVCTGSTILNENDTAF